MTGKLAKIPQPDKGLRDCRCMAESGRTGRFDETNPIFVNHDLYFDRSPVPAELCVDRVEVWVRQLNSRRVRRPAAGYRY
jgi:hypothetical protein